MGKKDLQDSANRNQNDVAAPGVSGAPRCEDALALGVRLLRQGLYNGLYEPVRTDLAGFDEMEELLLHVREVQSHLAGLARGNISRPVPLKGYTADLLREMQENLHHVIWKARRLTVGDFSCDAGCMGELSEAFEVMGKTLQTALVRLEQQKQDLTELSENLRREIDARAAVEEILRREQAQLQKLASTDPLTGIPNRRQFFQTAVRELERLRRTQGTACLAMLDIDHFKALNDNLGHTEGDKALTHMAKIISNVIRPYDLAGRYGGDEFVFLFPETRAEDCRAILERLRICVENENISAGPDALCLTVSIGLTELDRDNVQDAQALDQAITRADEALYRAKQASRNRICVI